MCGVIGVFNHPQAAKICYLGLQALQHRGQEAAGIATPRNFHHGSGLVTNVFNDNVLNQLIGSSAIGHVRYSTAGGADPFNIQPLIHPSENISISHNGNIINAPLLRNKFESEGYRFRGKVDTEVIFPLLDTASGSLSERLLAATNQLLGAFSLLVLTPHKLVVIRDNNGFRPLVYGYLDGAFVVASEVSALNLIGASYERDIDPGEILSVYQEDNNLKCKGYWLGNSNTVPTPCIFEHVYFSRPDSRMEGRPIYSTRERMGVELAKEHPVDADVVISAPDSGNIAALGYAKQSGIPFAMGLIKSHYAGRSFIQPTDKLRTTAVRLKFCVVNHVIRGKRVVVIDDSLVRGTTSRRIVQVLKEAGAKEVHMRISAPPTVSPCYYGIDTPSKEELLAANKSQEEIREIIGCDSLKYLSLDGLKNAVGGESWCTACFTGKYPTKVL